MLRRANLLIMRFVLTLLFLATGLGGEVAADSGPELRRPSLPAPRLQAVSFVQAANGYTQVVRLHLNGRVTAFSNPQTTDDGRLQVWLYNVKRASNFDAAEPQAPVRAYETRPSRGHVVVLLEVFDSVLGDVYRDADSNDLLIALSPVGADFDFESNSLGSGLTLDPGPTPPRLGDSVSEAASRWRLSRVVIDAGHGGKDPGATAPGRIREKDIVLPIALKLGKYLEDLLGIEVIYTREDDTFIPLRQRGRIANSNAADLFISIHANSATNRSAHGTETYFLGMNKEKSAQRVIERENSVIQQYEQDQPQYEQVDQAAFVRRQLAQSAFLRQSEELATRIEHDFSDRVDRKSRGVKEGNLQVLWAAAMPAVLVEVGFISNPREARFLRSAEGITFMASSIYRAVRDYKASVEESLSLSSDD